MFDEFQATLQDPHARHALVAHFPIAMAFVAVPAVVALAATGFRHRVTAVVTIVLLLVAAAGGGLAAGAGEEAYEIVRTTAEPALTEVEDAAMERHEGFGEGYWMWPAAAALFVAGTLIPKPRVRYTLGLLAVLACLVVAGRTALTGKTGGDLVYDHGLGVPARSTE